MGASSSKKAEKEEEQFIQNVRQLWVDGNTRLQDFPPMIELQNEYTHFISKGCDYFDTFMYNLIQLMKNIEKDNIFNELVNSYYIMILIHPFVNECYKCSQDESVDCTEEQIQEVTLVLNSANLAEKFLLELVIENKKTAYSTKVEDLDKSKLDLYKSNIQQVISWFEKCSRNIQELNNSREKLTDTLYTGFKDIKTTLDISDASKIIISLCRELTAILSKSINTGNTAEFRSVFQQKTAELKRQRDLLISKTGHIDISNPESFLNDPILKIKREDFESLTVEQKNHLTHTVQKEQLYICLDYSSIYIK